MRKFFLFTLFLLGTVLLSPPTWAARERSAACPTVWVVSYENNSATGWSGVEIAEGFSGNQTCVAERQSTSGAFAKVELRDESVQFDVRISPGAACAEKNPCTIVVGIRVPTCEDVAPIVSRADGALSTSVKKQRTLDGNKELCETEIIVAGYIYRATTDGSSRALQGRVALAYLSNLPDRPVAQP